ncbi:MAG: dockerin type I repeat-containing protein, partial [Clostridia bacterium]|nr:dockerin type I repeat-containing protein [Clostridia bacterium]
GKPVVKNDQTTTATLCYDTDKACFTCKKNNTGAQLTVYAVSDSSLFYTTELANGPAPTATVKPTATPKPTATVKPTATPTATVKPTATPTATPAPLYGDANCSGDVTAADAALVLRALVGLNTLTEQGMRNALVSGGETLSAEDAAMILRYVVRLIETLVGK